MKFKYHNVWFINFAGIGNGVIIAPILRCFEKSCPLANYYHTENQMFADQWFIEKAGLKKLKGLSPLKWRRFKKEDWQTIKSFIKEKSIDLIINLRNEGPRYDIGYYQFKEKELKREGHLDFWDLDFKIIEQRTIHQNLTGDILALLKLKGIDVSSYNSKWLISIRENKNNRGIGFGIAASQINKRWPTAKWIELAHKVFATSDQNIVLFPGRSKEEAEEATSILRVVNKKRCRSVTNQSLENVALQISELLCFVSNDTGLLHIATAIGVPTVGLYISTNSEIWSPYDKTNFAALQNTFIEKCSDPKPHCGNCFHYYDICPAIAKYGDDISPSMVYKSIVGLVDL